MAKQPARASKAAPKKRAPARERATPSKVAPKSVAPERAAAKKSGASESRKSASAKAQRGWKNPKSDMVAFAKAFPEAWEDHPWGEIVVKVKKKVFVFFGVEQGLGDFGMCVKLPHSRAAALKLPQAEPAGYGLGKSGWVVLRFYAGDDVPLDDVREWIEESYCAVAPKTLVDRLADL